MGDNFSSTKENVCPKLFYNYHLHMESRTGHVVSPYTHYLNTMFCLQIIQPISTILYICIFKIRSESDLQRVPETKKSWNCCQNLFYCFFVVVSKWAVVSSLTPCTCQKLTNYSRFFFNFVAGVVGVLC